MTASALRELRYDVLEAPDRLDAPYALGELAEAIERARRDDRDPREAGQEEAAAAPRCARRPPALVCPASPPSTT